MNFRVYDLNVDTDVPTLFTKTDREPNFFLRRNRVEVSGNIVHDVADYAGGPRLVVNQNENYFDLDYRGSSCRLHTDGIEIDDDITAAPELTRTLNRVVFPIHAMMHRDCLALHASVLTIDAVTVGFLGESHIGKSTLARHLRDLGHELITDDLAVLDGIEILPGLPSLRLWEDAGTVSDVQYDEVLMEQTTKRWFLPTTAHEMDRRTLTALVHLTDGPFGFCELPGARSLPVILQQNFALQSSGPNQNHRRLQLSKSIVDNVPVFATGWPRTENVPDLIDTLLHELPKWI